MDDSIFEGLELKHELLCKAVIYVDAGSPGPIGATPWGTRVVAYISEGEFEGPKMKGRVMPGGGDWLILDPERPNATKPDVRAVWETHDGAKLYLSYSGRIIQPTDPETDASDYYFRVAPTFETSDSRYAWLNDVQAIGVGRLLGNGVAYRIYHIL